MSNIQITGVLKMTKQNETTHKQRREQIIKN